MGSSIKTVNWVLPKSALDPIIELSSSNKLYKKSSTSFYKYLFIVNKVTRDMVNRYHNHKESRKLTLKDYKGCLINRRVMSTILGSKDGETSELLNDLVDKGVLLRTEMYVKGANSYRYRLVDCSDKMLYMKISSKDSIIPNKIVKRYHEVRESKLDNSGLKLYLNTLNSISIHNSIYYILDRDITSPSPISPMGGDFDKKCGKSVDDGIDITNVIAREISVRAIQDGDWYCVRPTEGSRVHTNLTNFPRDFRPFLQIDGKDVIELDIRNSQPLISSVVIKNYFMQRNIFIPDDVNEYKKMCEKGIFYDYFMELNNVGKEDRTEFKVRLFTEVFFSKVTNRDTLLKTQFRTKYPNCYKAICDIKGGVGSEEYNRFALMLQKKEAQIVYDGANLELIRKGIKAYNIFDSLLVKEEDMEVAKEALIKHFSKENLNPQINFVNLGVERKKIIEENMDIVDFKVNRYGLTFRKLSSGNEIVSYRIDYDAVVEALFTKEEIDELGYENIDYMTLYYKAYPEEYTEEVQVFDELEGRGVIKEGEFIPSSVLKVKLQEIYDDLGIDKKAKASDITNILGDIKESFSRINGKNVRGYKIVTN